MKNLGNSLLMKHFQPLNRSDYDYISCIASPLVRLHSQIYDGSTQLYEKRRKTRSSNGILP